MKSASVWTEEEVKILIELYGQGKGYSEMRDASPLLREKYTSNTTSLRDKILGLQKERIRNNEPLGELSRPLLGEKYDYRNYEKKLSEGTIIPRKRKNIDNVDQMNSKKISKPKKSNNPTDMCVVCPNCKNTLDSKYLLIVGIMCNCGVSPWELLNEMNCKRDWIVYIIQEKMYNGLSDPIEHIGVTMDLMNSIKGHTYFTFEIMKVFTTTRLYTTEIFKVPKKENNCLITTEKINKTIDALLDIKVCVDLPKFSNVKHKSVGLLFYGGITEPVFDDFCFEKDRDCVCTIQCPYRMYHNNWRIKYLDQDVDLWYPLSQSEIEGKLSFYPNEMSLIKKRKCEDSSHYPCSHSDDFYKQVMYRDRCSPYSKCKKLTNCLMRIKNDGYVSQLVDPRTMVSEMLYEKGYTIQTLQKKLDTLKMFLRNMTSREKNVLFGVNNLNEEINGYYKYTIEKRNEIYDLQEKNKQEREKWLPWDDLVELLPTVFEKGTDQEYLGYLLMIKQQTLRNDYATLKIVNYDDDDDKNDNVNENSVNMKEDNYIDFKTKEIVFNHHKNDWYMGKTSFPIKQDLLPILSREAYRRLENGQNFLFENQIGEQMSKNQFGKMMNDLTERLTGKRIGSQMMRKIQTSSVHKNDITRQEAKELAKSQMHSEDTSLKMYRKI